MADLDSGAVSRLRFSYYESIKIILGVACIALALGWGKFIGQTVYLPFYPDSLDVLLGVCIGIFLIFDYARRSTHITASRVTKGSTPSRVKDVN